MTSLWASGSENASQEQTHCDPYRNSCSSKPLFSPPGGVGVSRETTPTSPLPEPLHFMEEKLTPRAPHLVGKVVFKHPMPSSPSVNWLERVGGIATQ
jgi:hypothetical protein